MIEGAGLINKEINRIQSMIDAKLVLITRTESELKKNRESLDELHRLLNSYEESLRVLEKAHGN